MDTRIIASEIAIATTKESLNQVTELTKLTRAQQVEAILKFAEMKVLISTLETTLKITEDRQKTLVERIAAISRRLDQVPRGWSVPPDEQP